MPSFALTEKITHLHKALRFALAFAAGAIMVFAMPPWGLWPCLFIGFSAFYILLSTVATPRRAFGYGWLFGFAYFLFGLSWIGNALLVEGNKFVWAWPFAVAGLPALLAFFPAFASALIKRLADLSHLAGYIVFVLFMAGFEWLRGHIFTGFPWNLYGYGWNGVLPLAQLAAIGGAYWLSLLTCLWGALPAFLILSSWTAPRKIALLVFTFATIGGAYIWGQDRIKNNATEIHNGLAIRLVQPNIAQEDKWNPEKANENLQKILSLSAATKLNQHMTTLIIWPETAVSDFILMNENARLAIKAVLSGYEKPVYLLTGMLRFQSDDGGNREYFNSLSVFNNRLENIANYDKSHLVPFGEYIPFQKWIPIAPLVQFTGFVQGSGPTTINLPEAGSFSPLVCYEVIFPGAVIDPANRPDFLVNVTNDSWYGDSAGPRQHFAMARFRAIEQGLPIIRAANTGISGVFDPTGRIIRIDGIGKASGDNVGMAQKISENTLYGRYGDKIFFFSLGLLLILFLYLQVVSAKRAQALKKL